MKITGKIHLFFEQSGTFKQEFLKLGYAAEDYDIQDLFGQTDYKIDLFEEIALAYNGEKSVLNNISRQDLLIAFFPCTYFSCQASFQASWSSNHYKNKTTREKTQLILAWNKTRQYYYETLIKLVTVAQERQIRLIIENPWTGASFLKNNFLLKPSLIDYNRRSRGDLFVKPTAYWFINCTPTKLRTTQFRNQSEFKTVETTTNQAANGRAGINRSLITTDYARNFICDHIIGIEQLFTEKTLF